MSMYSVHCDKCKLIKCHRDMYNDEYCYDCIDIETGELKKGAEDEKEN